MKKGICAAISAVVVLMVAGYIYREELTHQAMAKLTEDMFVMEDMDDFNPGPALGSRFPGIRAVHRGNQITLLDEFAGVNGTLVIAIRSIDWCHYCIRQLMQLQSYQQAFEDAGIGLMVITYDQPDVQEAFAAKFGITIPLLSDLNALSFKTLGILNQTYEPGDPEYGIPYPGMIVIDSQGVIAGKLFIESYKTRMDSGAALTYAGQSLGISD